MAQLEAKRPKPVARPYPIKPAAELYGEIPLGTGDHAAAAAQFKAALARTPGRAASLLDLARRRTSSAPGTSLTRTGRSSPKCVRSPADTTINAETVEHQKR